MALCKWCGSQVEFSNGPEYCPSWERWFCRNCWAIGYRKDPSHDELNSIYVSSWDNFCNMANFATGSTSEGIADSILSAMSTGSNLGSCLDYGAGKGHFSKALCKRNTSEIFAIEPFGKDPGISQVIWLTDLQGLPKGKQFDWIFMIEVIEHLLDPVAELMKIRKYLKQTGKLVITTPNSKGWRARLGGNVWREAQNPTHIHLFSATALSICVQRAGFKRMKRVLKPVRYNAKGPSRLALASTQMLGIDGGLRVVVSD